MTERAGPTAVAGQSGLAGALNQVIGLCREHQVPDDDGNWTTADLVDPAEILAIIGKWVA